MRLKREIITAFYEFVFGVAVRLRAQRNVPFMFQNQRQLSDMRRAHPLLIRRSAQQALFLFQKKPPRRVNQNWLVVV